MQPIKWINKRLSKIREEDSEVNRKTEPNSEKTFSFVMQGNTSKAALGAVGDKKKKNLK